MTAVHTTSEPVKPIARNLASLTADFLVGIGLALAVAAIVAALFTDRPPAPPRVAAPAPAPIVHTTAAPTLIRPDLHDLSVVQLRTLARQQLGSAHRINGKRIAQARKDELLQALS